MFDERKAAECAACAVAVSFFTPGAAGALFSFSFLACSSAPERPPAPAEAEAEAPASLAAAAFLAAAFTLRVSAPFSALALRSASTFSFCLRSCSSRVPTLRVTFFIPEVKASTPALPLLLIVEDGAGAVALADAAVFAGWALGREGEAGLLLASAPLCLGFVGARVFFTCTPGAAPGGFGAPFEVVGRLRGSAGTGGAAV